MPPFYLNCPAETTALQAPDARRIERYRPLLRSIARKIHAHLPPHVELDDLISAGLVGLVAAVQKYDDTKDATFAGYVALRVRGAIMDELRRMDALPRAARRDARRLGQAVGALEQELGREPSEVEVADRVGVDAPALRKLRRRSAQVRLVSLDDSASDMDGEVRTPMSERLSDPTEELPGESADRADDRELVAEVVAGLGQRQRAVVEQVYRGGRKLADIAGDFGVTEARVCQIHAEAVKELRRRLSTARFS